MNEAKDGARSQESAAKAEEDDSIVRRDATDSVKGKGEAA